VTASPRTFTEHYSGRRIELFGIPKLDDIGRLFADRDQPFILLLATGTTALPESTLVALFASVLSNGCVYACCWGPQAAYLETCFDQAEGVVHPGNTSVVITTNHEIESLEDAIWFAVHAAYPDDDYEDGWERLVVVTVGNEDWRRRAEAYLAAGAPGFAEG
jgi:hypothetical protein